MQDVNKVLEKYGYLKENLIQIMLELQKKSDKNYLPKDWVAHVAKAIDVPISRIYSVITFYAMFSTEPRGKFVLEVCKSGPCHVTGAENVVQMLEQELNIKVGETTEDGLFTIERTNCFGACDIAPAVKIGDNVFGNLDRERVRDLIDSCREWIKNEKQY